MIKKNVLVFFAVLLMVAIVSACSSSNSSSPSNSSNPTNSPSSSQSSKQTLTIVNWKDYGSDDPAVVKEFEDKYNVKIVHEYMASEQELLTKVRTGGAGKLDI